MRSQALTRVVSPDGTWALTLYDGDGKAPFVHALNTADGTAFCVDLGHGRRQDQIPSGAISSQPANDWSSVAEVVDRKGAELASISTDDWAATEPGALASSGGSRIGWWLVLGAAAPPRLRGGHAAAAPALAGADGADAGGSVRRHRSSAPRGCTRSARIDPLPRPLPRVPNMAAWSNHE